MLGFDKQKKGVWAWGIRTNGQGSGGDETTEASMGDIMQSLVICIVK